MKEMGPVFARDGDQVIIKTSLTGGQAPFSLSWSLRGEPLEWTSRVTPYNRTGCVGVHIRSVGHQDEGTYTCRIANCQGEATFSSTLLVDCKLRQSQGAEKLLRFCCRIEFSQNLKTLSAWCMYAFILSSILDFQVFSNTLTAVRLRCFTVSFRSRAEGE